MLSAVFLFGLAAQAAAHGFIKEVTINGETTKAQKSDIKKSSFRAAPDNTGWIGDNFFDSDCVVCGCSETPNGKVAAPGGKNFADAGQSAGLTPTIDAGNTLTLHVAGEKGQGWPHNNGHMQVYLADCGDSCTNVDASSLKFFKIQSLKDGIPAMRKTFNAGADSNQWPVEIPGAVRSGKYIVRSELITYDQSSKVEGNQAQLYPFCSNIEVTNGGNANPATVSFPEVYGNDDKFNNANKDHVPGPAIDQAFGGTGKSAAKADAAAFGNDKNAGSSSSSSNSSTKGEDKQAKEDKTAGGSSSSSSKNEKKEVSSPAPAAQEPEQASTSRKCKRSLHRRHHARRFAHASR